MEAAVEVVENVDAEGDEESEEGNGRCTRAVCGPGDGATTVMIGRNKI